MKLIKISEPTLIVSVAAFFPRIEPDVYEAARYAWKVNINRAKKYNLVLARCGDKVVGAFRVTEWMEATNENFPREKARWDPNIPGRRYGFKGRDDNGFYVGKRVPVKYRGRNPVRYCDPE